MSKQDRMGALVAEVRACRKCELERLRRNPVPGEGSLDPAVMFIGEAPGYWEDVKGRPFVGAAGKLLDEMLSRIGLSRSQVYIANILSKAGFEAGGITKLRGRVYEADLLGFRVFLIPMYHPAAALYNVKYKDQIEDDFQLLRLELEIRRYLRFYQPADVRKL